MNQIDPYNVPELFRGVPRPKNHSKKYQTVIKISLSKIAKRIALKSAFTKTVILHNSIDSIESVVQSIEPIGSIVLVRADFKKIVLF